MDSRAILFFKNNQVLELLEVKMGRHSPFQVNNCDDNLHLGVH